MEMIVWYKSMRTAKSEDKMNDSPKYEMLSWAMQIFMGIHFDSKKMETKKLPFMKLKNRDIKLS